MIKKFIFTVVPLGLILVAWAQQDPVPQECVVVEFPGMCQSASGITIVRQAHIVAPLNYCASAGDDIQVSVAPYNGPVGTVETIAKDPANTWLNGTNDPDPNGFELIVPADVSGEYDYKVVFSDGYCIDPMIKVQDEI